MRGIWGWVGLLAVLLGGAAFAAANAGRLVIIDLGIVTLYQVPVTFVAFGGMVVGMGVMLLAGIRSDLKVRALLRQRKGNLTGGSSPAPGAEAHPADTRDPMDSTAESRMAPPHLSEAPPEVPESWDRSRQSELPIE
ncbi:MAG: hypothetical protein HKO53_18985 [Gemmatimonadetes bacterium]|nr:hypothetical protein [Gemmatimonadota bacterium]